MMERRAEIKSWKQLQKTSDASEGSQRSHSTSEVGKASHLGKGYTEEATSSHYTVGRPVRRLGGGIPLGIGGTRTSEDLGGVACAVKAARTVATRGWEDTVRLCVLSLPTPYIQWFGGLHAAFRNARVSSWIRGAWILKQHLRQQPTSPLHYGASGRFSSASSRRHCFCCSAKAGWRILPSRFGFPAFWRGCSV